MRRRGFVACSLAVLLGCYRLGTEKREHHEFQRRFIGSDRCRQRLRLLHLHIHFHYCARFRFASAAVRASSALVWRALNPEPSEREVSRLCLFLR